MRKLIASEYVTLDGVMEAPGSETSLGKRGGWSFLFSSEEHRQFKFDELLAGDAILLGRVTYDIFAASWPSVTGEFGDRMNSLPKYVVSTTLQKLEWNNSHLIDDARRVVEEVARLKEQPGKDILLFGSADLFHTLSQHDIIDEYRLMIYPVILGTGKRLFQEGNSIVLNLIESLTFRSGVVVLTYQPHGQG